MSPSFTSSPGWADQFTVATDDNSTRGLLSVNQAKLPAWSCDVCALCKIDAEALQRLLPLIGPVTRPDPTQPRRAASTQLPINDLPYDDHDRDRNRRAASTQLPINDLPLRRFRSRS